MVAVSEESTAKYYVDQVFFNSVDESSLLRLDPFEELNLDEQDYTIPNSSLKSPKTIIEKPTKIYFDSLSK